MELICTDQNGFRPVNGWEANALRYTFGVSVGSYLIKIIKVGYDPGLLIEKAYGRTISKTQVLLQSNYNSVNLFGLGVFIHEAAHIWQRNTGLHQGGTAGQDYDYNSTQLLDLKLDKEEHAEAVQDWFHLNYGIDRSLVSDERNQSNKFTTEDVWGPIIKVRGLRGFNVNDRSAIKRIERDLWRFVKKYYSPLIAEIRNPCHIPALRAAHCR